MTTRITFKKLLLTALVMIGFLFSLSGSLWIKAYAQETPVATPGPEEGVREAPQTEQISPYLSIEYTRLEDGTPIEGYIINGPPAPLPEYEAERVASMMPTAGATILPNFPSYSWVFGCSAVSGAMIAGYYDRGAYPNMYTGPTNGGMMPLTDTSWPVWSDGYKPYPNNPLIASHQGVDGKVERGSIDDYWVEYASLANDPYLTGGWAQHTWGTAIGDYMKTSQSGYSNTDGSTTFYNYVSGSNKLNCSAMGAISNVDGTYGRKLFFEARGYSVSDCYNQKTDNKVTGGFSLANFQAEINAGYPVLLNLYGHSIVGYGYSGSTIYIRDTWSNDPSTTPTMPWGGVYEGMELLSVSVVHPVPSHTLAKAAYLPLLMRRNLNQNPTDILLSNSSIPENQPINTVVGTVSTTDPDVGDTFTYSLVSGEGSTDNASFNISGNQLRSSAVFDYEIKNNYSIRIRATDQGGLFAEKGFVITISMVVMDPVVNGNFEQGHVGWTEFSSHGFAVITQEFPGSLSPYDGTWAAWLGGAYDDTSYIQQQIVVPSMSPYLSYWHWIASADICGYDSAGVLVNGVAVDSYWLCHNNETAGWVKRVVNLSAYAGQTITLQLRAQCDGVLNSNLFVDHVAFQTSPTAENPLSTPDVGIDARTTKMEVLRK